jgi:general secretion pathway protein K
MRKNNCFSIDGCGMHSPKGAALMIVLWVMVLLTVIAGEFVFSMRTEMNITVNFKEETEAYYAALAGVENAKAEILSSGNEMKLDDNGILVFGDKQPQRRGSFGNAGYSYDIIDEERCLNINVATPEQ